VIITDAVPRVKIRQVPAKPARRESKQSSTKRHFLDPDLWTWKLRKSVECAQDSKVECRAPPDCAARL